MTDGLNPCVLSCRVVWCEWKSSLASCSRWFSSQSHSEDFLWRSPDEEVGHTKRRSWCWMYRSCILLLQSWLFTNIKNIHWQSTAFGCFLTSTNKVSSWLLDMIITPQNMTQRFLFPVFNEGLDANDFVCQSKSSYFWLTDNWGLNECMTIKKGRGEKGGKRKGQICFLMFHFFAPWWIKITDCDWLAGGWLEYFSPTPPLGSVSMLLTSITLNEPWSTNER